MFYIEIKAKAMQKYTFSSENCLLQLNMKFLSPFKGDCYERRWRYCDFLKEAGMKLKV